MTRWEHAQADEVRAAAAEVAIHGHALDICEVLDFLHNGAAVRRTFSAVTIADLRYAHERLGAILAIVDPPSNVDSARAEGGRPT